MDQKRLYLAMILSGVILLVWQMFFAPEPPEVAQDGEEIAAGEESTGADAAGSKSDRQDADESDDDASAALDDDGAPAKAPKIAPKREIPLRQDNLVGDSIQLTLTNKSASVVSSHILKPEQYAGEKPGDLVGFPADAPEHPFSLSFIGQDLDLPEDAVYEVIEKESTRADGDGFGALVYRYDDPQGQFRVDKVYKINPSLPYIVDLDVIISNTSTSKVQEELALDILDWKDPDEKTSFLNFNPIQVEGVCKTEKDTERKPHKSLLKESESFAADPVLWGAVDTRYFMLAAVPEKPAASCAMEVAHEDYVRTRIVSEPFTLSAGKSITLSHQLFMGPKDVDVLHEVGHQLSDSVDYGIFAFVARPMRWGLAQLFKLVGNWGLAIILLTFLIRGALWPINMKAYSSMERMKKVQPFLNEIKEKYKDDRQRQTEETMRLFKEHNVSPAGGCLPMLLQMPVLYGLYVCIYNSVDLYNAKFLYFDNLAAPDPLFILPIIMGGAMYLQQMMSTADTQNKQAMMMMRIMPVMFTAFMFFLPAGLVLYYALSLLLGIGQQYFIRKKFRTEEEPAKA